MKRLLILIGILLFSLNTRAADSKVSALPGYTVVTGDEYMYIVYSGVSYKIKMDTILYLVSDSVQAIQSALEDSCSDLRTYIDLMAAGSGYFLKRTGYIGGGGSSSYTLYPTDGTSLGLYLGYDPTSYYVGYRFYVSGDSYFDGNIDMSAPDSISWNNTAGIRRDAYDSLRLWDIYAGNVGLSQLLNFPASLSANTTVNTLTYDLAFTDASDYGYFRDYSEDLTTLTSGTDIILTSPSITLAGNVDTIDFGGTRIFEVSANSVTYIDQPYTNGNDVTFTFRYLDVGATQTRSLAEFNNIQLTPSDTYPYATDAEPGDMQYDASEDLIYYYAGDAAGGGKWTALDTAGSSGTGGTYDSAAVWSGSRQYVHIFDTTGTKYDSVLVEIDSSDAVYCATLSVTTDNISDGDSLTFVTVSSGYCIIPMNYVIFYDYDDANTYTSDDATYSAYLEAQDATVVEAIQDGWIEASTDIYAGDISAVPQTMTVPITSLYLDWFTHTGTGTGTVIFKLYYAIARFN